MEEKRLYQGKAKELYATADTDVLRVVYLDQATALNGLRKDEVSGKGELNNRITSLIFAYLKAQDYPNHFLEQLSAKEQLVQAVEMLPLEVVLRNVATGSFVKTFGAVEGTVFSEPLIDYYYKNDELDDPLMTTDHITVLGLATAVQLAEIKAQTLKLNQLLTPLFEQIGLTLVDFKVEYGLTKDGAILLADEITPDTCRLWDLQTKESLDKDVYRKETGSLVAVYEEVLARLERVLANKTKGK